MRALLHLPIEIASALLFAASIGIGAGVVVISYTHRLGHGLTVAPIVFVLACVAFGYVLWRTYRPTHSPGKKMHQPRIQTRGIAA